MCIAAWISLSLLVLISVFFGNLSFYAAHDAKGSVIMQSLLYSMPQIVHWVLPFSVCIGIIAAQASFSRHVETIAMQACSISFLRISVPYLAMGLMASLIMCILSFYLYPVSQRYADKIEDVYIKKRDIQGSFTVNGGRFKLGGDIYYVKHMDISKGIMQNATCYRTASGRLSAIIRTDLATWDGKTWKTNGMEIIRTTTAGIEMERSASALPLTRGPSDLLMAQPRPEVLTLTELFEYRSHLKEDNIRSVSLDTYFHSRISFAIAPLIMTLLVLPFGMRFPRAGGIARGISIGLILGLAYWALHSAMTGVGVSGYLHPAAAAWTADVVALVMGMSLMMKRRGAYG
jgi:lipopolysaccharide export system permease protein